MIDSIRGRRYSVYVRSQSSKTKNMAPEPITNHCPYCQQAMQVSRMTCPSCEISVEADFPAPRLARPPVEPQRFNEMFVLSSGNLKAIAEQAGVSYPTVRSRLDKIIDALRQVILETNGGGGKGFWGRRRARTAGPPIKGILSPAFFPPRGPPPG